MSYIHTFHDINSYIRLNKLTRQGEVYNEIFLFIYIWNNYVDLECCAFA